jgi:hypothetical protein
MTQPIPTTADVVALLADKAGMRVLAQAGDIVIAERAVLGVAGVYRRVLAQWSPLGYWRLAVLFTVVQVEADDVVHYRNRVLANTTVSDLDEMGLWVGGHLSKPYNETEIKALIVRPAPVVA